MKHFDSNLPAVPEPIRPVAPLIVDAEYESAAAHVPLSHYLWILRRHGWKMLGFVALVVLCTAGHFAAAHADLRIDRHHRHRPPDAHRRAR